MDKAVNNVLESLGITTAATFIPHKTPAGETPQLRWRVSVRRNGLEIFSTEYSAGCAHAPSHKGFRGGVTEAIKAECETGLRADGGGPVPSPSTADVLYCLVSDAQASDAGSFEEWAGDLGYDPDSRTAERVYKACMDVAAALERAFTPAERKAMAEAFNNY